MSIETLSPREREVLILASKGCVDREIGRLLSIGRYTVNDHMRRLFKKLDVNSRVEAAVIAAKAGLV